MVKRQAFYFILAIGIVSLFADMTHEGARSILGPYLTLFGMSAAAIAFVAGFGEFVGYALRFFVGIFAERSNSYWVLIIFGYIINVMAIPLLGFVQSSYLCACLLIILERLGKAVRQPAKNTLLSLAGEESGVGRAFAIQGFLDQLGAFLGPCLLFFILTTRASTPLLEQYRFCFYLLAIPAILCICFVFIAKGVFPSAKYPQRQSGHSIKMQLNLSQRTYLLAIICLAASFIDFPLITLYAYQTKIIAFAYLPLLYSEAMLFDAFAELILGYLFDSFGINVLIGATFISLPFTIFIFLTHSLPLLLIGIALWGIGIGAQGSVMKALVAALVPANLRAIGFGFFDTCFGIAWFLGSWYLGYLYDLNKFYLILFSVAAQLLAIIFLFKLKKIFAFEQ